MPPCLKTRSTAALDAGTLSSVVASTRTYKYEYLGCKYKYKYKYQVLHHWLPGLKIPKRHVTLPLIAKGSKALTRFV